MAGYIGSKAVNLSTTGADIAGDADVSGDLTVDTNTLHVDSTNNRVGIGTDSPSTILHVSSSDPEFMLTDTSTGVDHSLDGNSGTGVLRLHVDKNSEASGPAYIINMAGSEAMRIDSSGNVGIGTSSPSHSLQINGSDNAVNFRVGDASGNNSLRIYNNTTSNAVALDASDSATNMQFAISGTERMRIDSAGRVTTPYQPAFMAYAGGDVGFNAPQSTWADLNVFGSVNHNRGNHYNSSTCNFTCPVSGVYHFYVNVREETYYGSWGGIHIQLVTNGSRFAEIRKWDGYQNEETLTLSVTRQFSANDVVGVRVHSDSSDTNLAVEGGTTTFFGGHLLG